MWDWIVEVLLLSACNLVLVSGVYLAVFLVGCLVISPLAPRTSKAYSRRVLKLGLFLLVLLLVGDFFSCVWGEVIWGRFYRSTDYAGVDFLPFMPLRQVDIEGAREPHDLTGITLFQLKLVWLTFLLGTWGVTLFLFRKVAKRMGDFPYAH